MVEALVVADGTAMMACGASVESVVGCSRT